MSFQKQVDEYADKVLSGDIVAGRFVKYACHRYQDDLKHGKDKGFYLDERIADAQVRFMQGLKHTKGSEWAGKPFILSPCQLFIAWNILGFRSLIDKSKDGVPLRRFREAYVTVARKWGKSTFAAAIIDCLLFSDLPVEVEAEVYVTATKWKQAVRVVNQAARMIQESERLKDKANIYYNRGEVAKVVLEDSPFSGSYLEALGSDTRTADALNPHLAVQDELHEWRNSHRDLKEKLESGFGARPQPLSLTITTAGSDQSILWLELDSLCVKVLESSMFGDCIDETIFAFIARIDEQRPCDCGGADETCEQCGGTGEIPGDDPLDPANWQKANPDIGVTPNTSFLEREANKAKNSPPHLNQFIRYHCNAKVRSASKFISPKLFAECAEPLEKWDGNCSGGWDIGVFDDLSGIARCKRVGDDFHFSAIGFCPQDGARDLEKPPFKEFLHRGELIATPGDTTDIATMRDAIESWSKVYGVGEWAFDQSNSMQLGQDIEKLGIDCCPYPQTYKWYNEPMQLFLRLLREGRIKHDGSELLKWCFGNMSKKESGGLWMPDKDQSEDKIDPAVACLMAFRLEALGGKNKQSVYKKRGVYVV